MYCVVVPVDDSVADSVRSSIAAVVVLESVTNEPLVVSGSASEEILVMIMAYQT